MRRSCRRFQTIGRFPGSMMSCATPFMNFSSVCEPSCPDSRGRGIGVDIDGGVAVSSRSALRPIGGAEQALFLAVPGAVENGALRFSSPA